MPTASPLRSVPPRRALRATARRAAALALAAVALAGAGCRKATKEASRGALAPEVSGLAAVPASAEVVIGVDVARVVAAPLVGRAVERLLLADGGLAARWAALREACKLDLPAQVQRVMLAIGPRAAGGQPGTGPVLLVATGKLDEPALAACVRTMVGRGGGELTARPEGGRTLYQARDAGRTMYFAFGRPDTVILGSSEPFVLEALGAGKKALDNPALAGWLGLVDQKAPVWAAGRVDERVRAGLVRVTAGQLVEGPSAMVVSADLGRGADLEVGAVMATDKDASALESFSKSQLALIGMAAQARGLGALVDRVAISAQGPVVRFRLAMSTDEVNQLLSAIDTGGPTKQDATPPQGAPTGSAGAAR